MPATVTAELRIGNSQSVASTLGKKAKLRKRLTLCLGGPWQIIDFLRKRRRFDTVGRLSSLSAGVSYILLQDSNDGLKSSNGRICVVNCKMVKINIGTYSFWHIIVSLVVLTRNSII